MLYELKILNKYFFPSLLMCFFINFSYCGEAAHSVELNTGITSALELSMLSDFDAYDKKLFLLGEHYRGIGESLKASSAYWKIVEGFPESPFYPDSMLRLGQMYQKLGDLQKSRDLLAVFMDRFSGHYLEHEARDSLVSVERSLAGQLTGSRKQAAGRMIEALKLQRSGDNQAALEIYQNISVPQWSEEIRLLSIVASCRNKDFTGACKLIEEYRSDYPESKWNELISALAGECSSGMRKIQEAAESRHFDIQTDRQYSFLR
ncbi:MAG: tetratricopeptide repeat protein, partial [Candidatus Wallbacteria bacterium]|nr:tetratricopeptide repeat protein [Candidatus Wallbacteria bacterium]